MSHPHVSYPDLVRRTADSLDVLRESQPGLMHGFRSVSESALEAGSLPARTKELMALALGIASHCDECIAVHARALVAMHATPAEVQETVAVAVYMGGGPSLMYGAHALAAYAQFSEKSADVRSAE